MALAHEEKTVSTLAAEWIEGLTSSLEDMKSELSALSTSLRVGGTEDKTADAVKFSIRLRENALALQAKNNVLITAISSAPSQLELLDRFEASLDAHDAALDAFEDALFRKHGIPPVDMSEPFPVVAQEQDPSAGQKPSHGSPERAAGDTAPADPDVGFVSEDENPEWKLPSAHTPARLVRTPAAPSPVRDLSLPPTPTLADFGMNEDTLNSMTNPSMRTIRRRPPEARPVREVVAPIIAESGPKWSAPRSIATARPPRTPSPPVAREMTLPPTPTLEDFGLSEDALDTMMMKSFTLEPSGKEAS